MFMIRIRNISQAMIRLVTMVQRNTNEYQKLTKFRCTADTHGTMASGLHIGYSAHDML